MEKFEPKIEVENDGEFTPIVRDWSLSKFKLVGSYCDIFTSGMKYKWNQLVYIDLFAGAGHVKIKESNKIYLNSALVAMSIPNPFSKYILVEKNEKRYKALSNRVNKDFSHLNVEIIFGDSNLDIDLIKSKIPKFSKGNTMLPFCFVDPYSLNLNFSTIKSLGSTLMDFLILQALHMDANRNLDIYLKEENNKISNYLGISNWREEFENSKNSNLNFVKYLADKYQEQMKTLGYQDKLKMHQIRSNEKNLPLYYLAFYSKNKRGIDFFNKVEKRMSPQLKLF